MENEVLYALIRRFEGLRLKPYLCPAGRATIGYGSTRGVTLQSPPITRRFAEELMREEAARFLAAAARLSPILLLHPDKHAAIADFCFNLGVGRYKASTLRKRVNAGDWQGAAVQIRRWVYGDGRKLPGLVARREAESLLLLKE